MATPVIESNPPLPSAPTSLSQVSNACPLAKLVSIAPWMFWLPTEGPSQLATFRNSVGPFANHV